MIIQYHNGFSYMRNQKFKYFEEQNKKRDNRRQEDRHFENGNGTKRWKRGEEMEGEAKRIQM